MSFFQLKGDVVGVSLLTYFAEFVHAAMIFIGCSVNVHESCEHLCVLYL